MVEIVTVSDIYDALTSGRPYRPVSYDNRTTLEEITVIAEKDKVSLGLVRALISHNRAGKPHYSEVMASQQRKEVHPLLAIYTVFLPNRVHLEILTQKANKYIIGLSHSLQSSYFII